MRLGIVSDIHPEFYAGEPNGGWADLPSFDDVDVLAICGDFGVPLTKGLRWVGDNFAHVPNVIVIAGNHEFYKGEPGSGDENAFMQEQLARGREMAAGMPNVHFLDNDVLVLEAHPGIRFLGATTWSDLSIRPDYLSRKQVMSLSQRGFADERERYKQMLPHRDFREIRYGAGNSKHRFTPAQMLALHEESRAFFERALSESFAGETICLSHMGPAPSVADGDHSWLYGWSDMLPLLDGPNAPSLWCHGHVHSNFDYSIGRCRVLCNPRAYPSENPNFNPRLTVEIDEPAPASTYGM
jgi:hypothetical protein